MLPVAAEHLTKGANVIAVRAIDRGVVSHVDARVFVDRPADTAAPELSVPLAPVVVAATRPDGAAVDIATRVPAVDDVDAATVAARWAAADPVACTAADQGGWRERPAEIAPRQDRR